ncbi:MAG TPA: hypothetical protein VEQ58_12430, partial [Polyangiaceae bacterium]|nr:hypothetical protein [Polyangiaceae bacterium]
MPLGGLSRSEAEQRLLARSQALAKEKLRLALGGHEASVSVEELGLELVSGDSAARALGVARSAGLFANALHYLRSFFAAEELPAVLRVDHARFVAALGRLEPSLIDDPPFAGGLTIENAVARPFPPRSGRKIAVDAAL